MRMYLLTQKKGGCISAVHVEKKKGGQSKEEAVTGGCVSTLNHASVHGDIKGGQEANGPSLKRPQDLLVPRGKQAQMSKTSLRKKASVHPFKSFGKRRRPHLMRRRWRLTRWALHLPAERFGRTEMERHNECYLSRQMCRSRPL